MTQTLLVVDTNPEIVDETRAAARSQRVRVVHAVSAAAAVRELQRARFDLVLCAAEMEGEEGFDIVPQLRRLAGGPPIALLVSGDPFESARDALARGVCETLQRPICAGALQLLLQRCRDARERTRTLQLLRREHHHAVGEQPVVAASPKMIRVLEALERTPPGNAPKLIRGEPGTGRQTIARALHTQSAEGSGPFVSVSCTGRDESELEHELFGTPSNESSTRALATEGLLFQAQGGTLYLAEIGALSPRLQTRLASILEAGRALPPGTDTPQELAVQIVASTERDLAREAKSGRFDEELFARFGSHEISVPPLRERREDIPLLADALIGQLNKRYGRDVPGMTDAALEALTNHSWPGNLHELQNTLAEGTRQADGDKLDLADLPDALQTTPTQGNRNPWALRPARHRAEAATIRRALRSTGGNRTHAARLLGISQRALLYKIKDYGIRD